MILVLLKLECSWRQEILSHRLLRFQLKLFLALKKQPCPLSSVHRDQWTTVPSLPVAQGKPATLDCEEMVTGELVPSRRPFPSLCLEKILPSLWSPPHQCYDSILLVLSLEHLPISFALIYVFVSHSKENSKNMSLLLSSQHTV